MTKLTPIFGYTFCSRKTIRASSSPRAIEASTSASYKANVAKRALFPLSDTSANDASDPSIAGDVAGDRGYFEARNMIHDLKTLESHLKNLTALGLAEKVLVVSMGDFQGADERDAGAKSLRRLVQEAPRRGARRLQCELRRLGGTLLVLEPFAGTASTRSPTATALLKKYLKNANIGANFSPLTYDPSAYTTAAYLYTVNKGVRAFRRPCRGARTIRGRRRSARSR